MYLSASHWIDSSNSASVMKGNEIFLTMTECPETEDMASFVFVLEAAIASRMVSIIVTESIRAPSTIASGGRGDIAQFCNLYPFLSSFNSTSLIELHPISRPMTSFFLLKNMFHSFLLILLKQILCHCQIMS